ncbi:MAG: ribonuclease P protein component [Rikenellaceae bacterium]|nr:ribonuclease P protein component [Rikenellaceae bacterium]
MNQSLSRRERLRTLGAIRRLFESGEGGFVYPFRYLCFAEADTMPSVRLLFSVPKRYHKRANKRNLLKRRMREAYRLNKAELGEHSASMDLALIYSAKEVLSYARMEHAIKKILAKVAENV